MAIPARWCSTSPSYHVRNWLNKNYRTSIGQVGTVSRPTRSPNLSPIDIFELWGFIKQEVFSTPVIIENDLLNRINAAFIKVRETLTYKVTLAAIRKSTSLHLGERRSFRKLASNVTIFLLLIFIISLTWDQSHICMMLFFLRYVFFKLKLK